METGPVLKQWLRRRRLRREVATGANFEGADLSRAQLHDLDLRGKGIATANLRYAYLIVANFEHAQLDGADFTETTVD